MSSNRNGSCYICNKGGHEPIDGNKRKGCGKCARPEGHRAVDSACPTDRYPPPDRQVCDECLQKDHTYSECKNRMGEPCKLCGHGGHKSPLKGPCPLAKGLNPDSLPDYVVNLFTEACAVSYREERKKKETAQSQSISSPAKSPGRKMTELPDRPSPTSPKSSENSSAPLTANPEPENFVDQKQKWWTAEIEKIAKTEVAAVKDVEKTPRKEHEIEMSSNFFEFQVDPKVNLMRYSIIVREQSTPSSEDDEAASEGNETRDRRIKRGTKRFLIKEYLKNSRFGNVPSHSKWASDYESIIISVGDLYNDKSRLGMEMLSSVLPSRPLGFGRSAPPPLMVRVDGLGTLSMQPLINHVGGKTPVTSIDEQLKALNIICWKEIHEQGDSIGGRVGNKVYPKTLIGSGGDGGANDQYVIRHGVFSSMRPGQESILLNVNGVTSAFFAPIKLQKWMELEWGENPPSSRAFKWKLKSVRVTFDQHRPSRNWVICGISPTSVGETTFPRNGQTVSVSNHMQDTYGYVQDPNSFCINVGSDRDTNYLPADQLTIVPWQIVTETMTGKYSERMIQGSVGKPQFNKHYIMGHGLETLGLKSLKSFNKDFGLSLKELPPAMVKIIGYKLNPPKVKVKSDSADRLGLKAGSWNPSSSKFWLSTRIRSLAVVNLSGITISCSALLNAFDKYGMAPSAGKIEHQVSEINPQSYAESPEDSSTEDTPQPFRARLQEAVEYVPVEKPKETEKKSKDCKLLAEVLTKYQFLLVFLPEKGIPLYCEVKRWTDCILGIPSSCITLETFQRVAEGTNLEANVCLKINFKLGGTSHSIDPSGSAFYKKSFAGARDGIMNFGADVIHRPQKVLHCPSIAAVVATHEEESCHYFGAVRLQASRQEFIADLKDMVKEHLRARAAKTKKNMPKNIFFYRDGVSDSQFGMVSYEEMPQIRKACEDIAKELKIPKSWSPKITLLVVTKRHHARFFHNKLVGLIAGDDSDINVPSGTVADTKVVAPNMWNFYLQSHHSKLGTTRGAHYVVIHDEAKYMNFEIHHITNNLCYTNQRATNAMSVCTPARYADFLCDRMRCYMRPIFDGSHTMAAQLDINRSPVLDENGLPLCVTAFETDSSIWRRSQGRSKPWHAKLDKVMFYL